ncbi:MAG: hypothetical protein R3C17_08830 [Planctomycetaceae bacterium]
MNTSPFQSSIEQVIDHLPAVRHIHEFAPDHTVDCIVAISGFEKRCISAAHAMIERGWVTSSSICVTYGDPGMKTPNERHLASLCTALTELGNGNPPRLIEHNDHNVEVDFGQSLLKEISDLGVAVGLCTSHIVFDITVGSSRLLLEGLHALLKTNARLTLIYTEAGLYRPRFDEYVSLVAQGRVRQIDAPEFLTQGVDRVEIVNSIQGMCVDSRPAFLVVFPAFAFTRISAVIDEIAPSRVQWIYGIPHLVENRWRIDAQREYHATLVEGSHRHCYVSTFDYRETLLVLERIYQKRREDYGIFVASLGSKLQKVGQALFHTLRPEAAAVVAIPHLWSDDRYSEELPRSTFVVPLGDCGSLRDALWRCRRLRL